VRCIEGSIKSECLSRLLDLVFRWFSPEVRIPITKCIFQAFIEHLSAHLKHQMGTFLRPLHLLLLGKPAYLRSGYRRFHKARRDRFLVAPAFAIIWNDCLVDDDICVELVERLSQFATVLSGKLFVIQETVDVFDPVTSSSHIPMPQVMFDAFQ
jgi:hypothetical protein